MTRVERWEKRAEVPLLLLAAAFLVAYAWPVLDPRLDRDLRTFLAVVSWTVYAAFAVDLLIRLALADERGRYALSHWYDLILLAAPLLRPLRSLRLLALVRVLERSAGSTLAGRAAVYVGSIVVAAVGLGALAVLDAEHGAADANITNFGDALWWASTTVTTVGYGDHFPVTTEGRLVAVVLMFVGIGLVGAATATAAAWLVRRTEAEQRAPDPTISRISRPANAAEPYTRRTNGVVPPACGTHAADLRIHRRMSRRVGALASHS